MLFRSALALCLLISLRVGSQTVIDTMYFNRHWEQAARSDAHYYRIISTDTSGQYRFMVEDFYLSGQVQMSGSYKSIRPDNKDGNFIYYYENGQKQMECFYEDNLLKGLLDEWYESGQHKLSRSYRNDLPDGPFTSWREDGSLKLQVHYSDGKKNGNLISYYQNGQEARHEFYENDQLIEGQCFTPSGEPTEYFPYIKKPRFPDGRSGLLRFIRKKLNYPPEASRRGYEGAVIVIFTVDEEGKVRDPQIANGDIRAFNREALRLAGAMPRWIPGEVDGIPSPMKVSIPIEFSLR